LCGLVEYNEIDKVILTPVIQQPKLVSVPEKANILKIPLTCGDKTVEFQVGEGYVNLSTGGQFILFLNKIDPILNSSREYKFTFTVKTSWDEDNSLGKKKELSSNNDSELKVLCALTKYVKGGIKKAKYLQKTRKTRKTRKTCKTRKNKKLFKSSRKMVTVNLKKGNKKTHKK
jgi:hypothetical protein